MSKPDLSDARLYLCTDARKDRGDLAEFLDAVLGNGVDVVQLRDKTLEAAEELATLELMADHCHAHGALLAVNDRADIAAIAGAHILHIGQGDLAPEQARRIVGRDVLIGRSNRSVVQAQASAADPDIDYVCLGPVWATPTKPGRDAIGQEPIGDLTRAELRTPWFAIGGIDETRLDEVLAQGARRIVVVRALTEADDPAAAAARIAARLAGAATATASSSEAGPVAG